MKKVLGISLVLTLLLSSISLASGIRTEAAFISNGSENSHSEMFELNGVQYFYEDTVEYTITITQALTGEKTIAFKDKLNAEHGNISYISEVDDSNDVNYSKNSNSLSNGEMKIKELSQSDIRELKEIRNKTLNSEIKLEEIESESFSQNIEDTSQTLIQPTNANKVVQKLTQRHGSEYLYRYLQSLTRNGRTGRLYQHRTYAASVKSSRFFDVLTGIGIIAAFYSTPINALIGIASWMSVGASGLQLLMPTNFTEWNASIHLQKVVSVGEQYPYRAFYDRHLNAMTGSKGTAVLTDIKRTFKNDDYDLNLALLVKGIDFYIEL